MSIIGYKKLACFYWKNSSLIPLLFLFPNEEGRGWGDREMKKFNWFDWLCLVLVIIGALNWGLMGFFKFNLVQFIFSFSEPLERVIYAIVGLTGLYTIFLGIKFIQKEHQWPFSIKSRAFHRKSDSRRVCLLESENFTFLVWLDFHLTC